MLRSYRRGGGTPQTAEANLAPTARALSLAHWTVAWVRFMVQPWAKPQSVPARTFSPTDHVGVAFDPLGNCLGMLNHVCRVRYHAGDQDLALGQPCDVSPYFPLVLVARVCRFDRIGLCLDAQHQVDDLSESGTSLVCGPAHEPQQMWYRM